jgi:hypothetical protein
MAVAAVVVAQMVATVYWTELGQLAVLMAAVLATVTSFPVSAQSALSGPEIPVHSHPPTLAHRNF